MNPILVILGGIGTIGLIFSGGLVFLTWWNYVWQTHKQQTIKPVVDNINKKRAVYACIGFIGFFIYDAIFVVCRALWHF